MSDTALKLADLRRALKPHGIKVVRRTTSHGVRLTFYHEGADILLDAPATVYHKQDYEAHGITPELLTQRLDALHELKYAYKDLTINGKKPMGLAPK